MAKIEIAYRTENLRKRDIKNHRKVVSESKLDKTIEKLEEQGAFDIYVSRDSRVAS